VTAFEGFTPDDFDVFNAPEFSERMALLRERVKPKLIQIGEALTPRLSEIVGEPLFPHVAQHLRRTVNPPEETWVAFAREKRAYKPFVHLRAAVSREKVRVTVFVEDYADDKALFANNLHPRAALLADHFARHPTIRAYEILDRDGEPSFGHALTEETLRDFAERMKRVKGQHAIFGVPFDRYHRVVSSGPEFLDSVVEATQILKPLYDCGIAE
jgi:uncharacterized protein YktB (UPF0637 family)